MAAGQWNMQKASGGVASITIADGLTNTDLVLPESGTVATTTDVSSAVASAVQTGLVALQTIATGTATFTATTNNINLTGIGVGVEIGDVIQISGAEDAKNNSEFTIEVITDANNIIVNQAHANKGTTKNVANRASDTGVIVKLLAKWYNASDTLGRDWVDVTSNRSINTPYPNNTKRAFKIEVCGVANQNGGLLFYSGTTSYSSSSSSFTNGGRISVTGLSTPTNTYKITPISVTASINQWSELR